MLSLFNAAWQIIAGGIVLILPGLTWSVWFSDRENDLLARLAEVVGLSVATTALVALTGYLIRWQFSPAWLLLLYGLMSFLALLGLIYRGIGFSSASNEPLSKPENFSRRPGLRDLILLTGLIAILGWRFYQARELVLPAWVDSLHHVLITRLLLETGSVPSVFDPYLPIPFYYHFAFHVLAAAFSFWSSLPPENAVLLIGQVLNAAVALSVYRLGLSLWADWRRAGLAALFVGFVSQMPAYYATWGRYTLLTGLVLLPLGMAVGLDLLHRGTTRHRIICLMLLTGGMLLTHYFAAMLFALFLVILGAEAGIRDLQEGRIWRESRFLPLFGASVGGGLLASPWILRVWDFSNKYVRLEAVLPVDSLDSLYFPNYLSYLWRMSGPDRNYLLLTLALLGLLSAVVLGRHRSFVWWTTALILLSIPWGVNLSPFRPDHGVIVLFLPAALLAADFLFTVGERAQTSLARPARVSLAAAVVSVLIWGLKDTRAILNPVTILATDSDLQAIQWIEKHTSPEARFFINVAPWQYGIYRGVDGGWWIHTLTGRETLLPPVMYALGDPEYSERISTFAEQASQLKGCTPEFQELLQVAGLTHIYLTQERGTLHAGDLKACPYVALVYQHQGVSIFRVNN